MSRTINYKVGDWVTNGLCTWRIDSIDEDMYYTNHCGIDCGGDIESIDKEYHLWTIQDAKDGDVLVCPKYANDIIPNIFIFKNIEIKDNDVYCYCSFLKVFMTGGYIANADPINIDFYPATKEQRDLLFQKMNESGYEWNANKKELKKIEKKPMLSDFFNAEYERGKADALKSIKWSEDDESMYTRTLGILGKCYMGTLPTKVEEELNWFKSLKERIGG